MNTAEVIPITEKGIRQLLTSREAARPGRSPAGKRRAPRWPFPGMVELWLPDEEGRPRHTLATSVNLSINGIGIRCDDALHPGTELEIAFHEPEVSFHGRAVVRHATKMDADYLVGMEFLFDVVKRPA